MLLKKNDRLLFFGDSVTDADRQKPDGEGIAVFNPWGSGYVGKIAGFLGGLWKKVLPIDGETFIIVKTPFG